MKYAQKSEIAYINCVADKLIDIICGDYKKSLKENLSDWIEKINLCNDRFHGKTLAEWRDAADRTESDEQMIDFLLLHFFDKSIDDYENLGRIAEVTEPFDNYINEIIDYSDIKKKFGAFIIDTSNNGHIPLYDVTRHIRSLVEIYKF